MANKRELLFSFIGKETISPAAKKAGDAVDKLGDELKGTAADAKKLEHEIDQAQGNLRDLAVQFARTEDAAKRMDLAKAMRKQTTELRKLTKAKNLLPDMAEVGAKGALGFAKSFSDKIGPLLSNAPVGTAGGVLGVALAGPVAATLAGAIVGAAGVGGVIGGLALASKDPAVKTAGKALADEVSGELEKSAQVFVKPAIEGIGIVRKGFKSIKPEIDSIFGDSSHFVEPLVTGAVEGAKKIASGVADAVHKAGPVINAFGRGFDRIGSAVGQTFSLLADDATNGASAIDDLTLSMSNFILATGEIIHHISEVKGWLDVLDIGLDQMRFDLEDATGWDITADGMSRVERRAQDTGEGLKVLRRYHNDAGVAARGQGSALDELATKLRAQNDPMFALIDAQNGLKSAQNDYNEAIKEHGKKSPEAQEALRNMATAAITLQAATGEAAGTFNGQLSPAMIATLKSAKFTDAQIAALQQQFINAKNSGEKFSKNYQATATMIDMVTAKAKVIRYEISKIHGKTVTIAIKYEEHGSVQGEHIIGQGTQLKAAGGPVLGPGPKGVDSVPHILAPGEYVLNDKDVDAMGGFAGVEKLRASLRSGKPVGSSASGGSAGGSAVQEIRLIIEGTGVLQGLRKEIRVKGGNVQAVLGK